MNSKTERCGCGLLTTVILACFLTGCTAPRTYIAKEFRRATYASLEAKPEPAAVRVDLTFQVNGKPRPSVTTLIRPKLSKILRASRVVSDQVALTNAPQLRLVVNNIADLADARAKGFATGLTLGAAGNAVVDFYEMTAEFIPASGISTKKSYKHALHTTFGAHSAPEGCEPVPTETGFDHVLEDMVLNLLQDLQKEKVL